MSAEQRRALDALLRAAPLDLGGDITVQRPLMEQLMTSHALPDDVTLTRQRRGGVDVIGLEIADQASMGTLLYFHGGAFALGSAEAAAGLAGEIARHAGARVLSVEYRLAPENPYPAAVEDALAVYRDLLERGARPAELVVAGESAGGGLAVSMLLAARRTGLALPAAAVVLSPWVDLTLSGPSIVTRASADPALTASGLRTRARDYVVDHDAADPLISPVFADLSGLPPLLIQVGGNEILLSDAIRLADRAAGHGVQVTLEVTADVPHVFPAFAAVLDEGATALDSAGRFISRHLVGPAALSPRTVPGR